MAKALCIILVVLMHCEGAYDDANWFYREELKLAWRGMNAAIRPLRMPLFFLVSGLLASASILRPDSRAQRNRFHRPLYLYLLWGALLSWAIPTGFAPEIPDNILVQMGMTIGLVAAFSWYMLALAVFFLFTKMTLRLPLPMVLLLCAGLSAVGTFYQDMFVMHQSKLLRCLFFFVVGARMRDQVLALGKTPSMARTVAFGIAFLAGVVALHGSDNYLLPVDVAAVGFGISLCCLLSERPSLMRPARWLARRTLPIYLLHFLMIPALAYIGSQILPPTLLDSFWFGLAVPLLSVPVMIVASLIAHRLLLLIGATWLFDLPYRARPQDASETPHPHTRPVPVTS